jgi:hypothetical protein
MAAQVVSALGEHDVQVAILEVERHEHPGVRAPVDVERDRVVRVEQYASELLADLCCRGLHPPTIFALVWRP